jgi:hypothetical protein
MELRRPAVAVASAGRQMVQRSPRGAAGTRAGRWRAMTGRQSQDARPLAAVVAVLVAVSVAGAAHSSLGLLHRAQTLAPLVVIPAVVIAALALACRMVATRRALASRTRLVLLAPDSFDPSLDAVLRCAAQLSRVRRLVGGWLDPRARAVRVLLDCDPEKGRMRYSLSVPERALPAVRSALGAFDRVQLQVIEPNAEPPTDGDGVEVVRAELRLARPSSEPLAHLPLTPDPLQGFARVLARLDPAHREQAEVAIDLLPTTAATRRRLRRRLLKEALRRGGDPTRLGGGHGPLDFGSGAHVGRRRPAEMVEQRAEREEIAAKLVQAEPIFRLQVLIRCCSPERGRAVACLQGLLSCFDGFAGANSLRVVGVRLFGLAFAGSDLPGRRGWFDHRMRTGLFRPARRDYVTAREMAGLLKPPTVKCAAPEVLRLGPAVYPAPRSLPTFNGQPNLVPLGKVQDEDGGERRIGLRVEDSFFTYTAGRSRWGKTELGLTQSVHLFRSGHGGLFLDPHQDAVQRLKSCLTEEGLAERVFELDLVGPRSRSGQPGWNLFAARNLDLEAAERRVDAIVDSFASALQWSERNNRALTLTTQATAALIELSKVLPDGLQPTIFQIPSILGNAEWLAAALPFLSPARRQFFTERFPRLSEEAITPVTNLIDRLRSSTQLAALLGAQTSTYDIARAMDERRIVLACPGAGGAKDKLVANLLVYDLLHGAKGRASMPPAQRLPFYVFLDEVQTYDGASNGTLASLLEQTAKYGIRATLLNQNPERLTSDTLNALTTNRSHLITTALNAHAAALIAREWGGDPPASAITGLPRWTFIAQVTHKGQLTRPFMFSGGSVEEQFAQAFHPEALPEVQATIDKASGRTSATETVAALDTLDERIKQHLENNAGDSNSPDSDQPWTAPAPSEETGIRPRFMVRHRGEHSQPKALRRRRRGDHAHCPALVGGRP